MEENTNLGGGVLDKMNIGKGTKFAAITINYASSELDKVIEVSEGVFIGPKWEFGVTPHWEKWLGELRRAEILDANLVLLTTARSSKPEILDDENERLQEKVIKLWYSVLLLGVPAYSNLNLLNGANVDDHPEPRQVARLPMFYLGAGDSALIVDESVATEAGRIFQSMDYIYSLPDKFIQLRKGIKVLIQAIAEAQDYDRLHEFVRSLTAITLTSTQKQFQGRCHTFTARDANSKETLEKMYALRSRVEHLLNWDNLFPGKTRAEVDKLTNHFRRQAEALAQHTYRKLLTNPSLIAHFETADSLRAFWGLAEKDRLALWSDKFNLSTVLVAPQP